MTEVHQGLSEIWTVAYKGLRQLLDVSYRVATGLGRVSMFSGKLCKKVIARILHSGPLEEGF